MRYLILGLSVSLLISNCVTAIKYVSPLQTFTLFDEKETMSPREKYLKKFKAGMEAAAKVRRVLEKKHEDYSSSLHKDTRARLRKISDHKRRTEARINKYGGRAYMKAVKRVEFQQKEISKKRKVRSDYQIVGVIDKNEKKKIKWYARKRPKDANWSLRLVHVDKAAIIKDLYDKGKVDIFAKYSKSNRPVKVVTETGDEEEVNSNAVQFNGKYSVRERSWRTLWNFSLKNVFTDPSGSFWRERRVRPGLYTDGEDVYEPYYDYRRGKNKMRRKYKFDDFLKDKKFDKSTKDKAKNLLNKNTPDLVIES